MLLENVIRYDTRANQPDADAVPTGTLYYVTDENVTERSNGTTWDDFSDTAPASAVAAGDYGDIIVSDDDSTPQTWTIDDLAVTAAKIAADAVTTVKILDNNVTTAKILDENVTYAKIQDVANGKVLGNFSGSAAAPSEYGLTSGLEENGSGSLHVKVSTRTRVLTFVFDGGGAEIADNVYATLRVPVAGTLTGWTILAKQPGAIKIDVWKDTLANYPPDNSDSITNGHEPEIAASGTNAEDTNISDWTSVAVTAGDTFIASVDSCTTIQWAILQITMTETG